MRFKNRSRSIDKDARIARLEREVARLRSKIEIVRQRANDRQERVAQLREQLEASRATATRRLTQVRDLSDQLDVGRARLLRSREQVSALRERLQASRANSDQRREQVRALRERLEVSQRELTRLRQHLPQLRGQPMPDDSSRHEERAIALLASGAFDATYYRTTVGRPDLTDRGAALHYVRHGSAALLNPHPLIETEHTPVEVRDDLRKGDTGALLKYLLSDDSAARLWGPLFDPRSFAAESGREALEVLRALGPQDTLPVPANFLGPRPTLAVAIARASAHSSLVRSQQGRPLQLLSAWDEARERAFREGAHTPSDGELVSVIMPAWNREATIAGSIGSVLAQTYVNWELLVTDDGSVDGTADVVRTFVDSDPRVRLVTRPHEGVSAARNAALKEARGSYVAFLDADNEWRDDFLSLSVGVMDTDAEPVATFSGMRIHRFEKRDAFRGGDVSAVDLQFGNSIDMNALVVRRSVLDRVGHFDDRLKRWVDYDLVLRLTRVGDIRYLPFLGCDYLDDDRGDRITSSESPNWQYVVMAKQAMDWDAVASGLGERVRGRVSVVMIAYEDHARTSRAVNAVLETTEDADVEVVILDNGSRSAVGRVLALRYALHPRVRYERLPRNLNFATGSNVGFAHTTGEFVMFLNNDTLAKPGWLQPLIERLQGSTAYAVQPLLLYPNGNIQTAGTIFNAVNGLATHFLHEHPAQDAARHSGKGFSAVTGGAMLIRATDFVRLRGFDPIYANGYEDVDFCLRAVTDLGATFEVEHRSHVMHEESKSPGRFEREAANQAIFKERWAGRLPAPQPNQYALLGFTWSHMRASAFPRPILSRPPRDVIVDGRGRIPSYRWSLKIGATGLQDRWGDVPFADDLAHALANLGQEVVVTRHGGHNQAVSYLDDVVLTIRGAEPVAPQAGRVNILWVISRAERVTAAEVQGYDLVFAASPTWAAWMAEKSGRRIEVMLQATAPERFNPDVLPARRAEDVLFVGGPRLTEGGRPIVNAALTSGADIALWGARWDEIAPPGCFRGAFLEFADAPAHYRAANLLLNDHMESMREWGFINNRVFDAVAAGVPVISDRVEGLELFGGAVRALEVGPDVVDALRDRSWVPDPESMARISQRIRSEHSFARRAEVLLDRVLELGPTLLVRP